VLTEPQLQQLVALALEHNRDLRVAVLNVAAMRAQVQRAGCRAAAHSRSEPGCQPPALGLVRPSSRNTVQA
jgi:hypothetical protein